MIFSEAALFLNERDKLYVKRHDFLVLHFCAVKFIENIFSRVIFAGKILAVSFICGNLFLRIAGKITKIRTRKISCHTVDKKRVYNAVYIFPPSPLPINSHNSLRVTENTINTFESAHAVEVVFSAWSVNFLDFFLAACSKVFRKASLRLWRNKSHDWQSLPSSNMVPCFVSFWLNGWNTDLGLETERHHIASFVVDGDESLASKSKL